MYFVRSSSFGEPSVIFCLTKTEVDRNILRSVKVVEKRVKLESSSSFDLAKGRSLKNCNTVPYILAQRGVSFITYRKTLTFLFGSS